MSSNDYYGGGQPQYGGQQPPYGQDAYNQHQQQQPPYHDPNQQQQYGGYQQHQGGYQGQEQYGQPPPVCFPFLARLYMYTSCRFKRNVNTSE